jgi:glyoxylase-like metal-dependent hydrolase (beta-lactamase superfamily II)
VTALREVAAGVHVLRYPVLDINVTLVVGDGEALLVDTLSTDAQARELAAAVRAVTSYPLTIVNTHHHFDHCFGNAVVAEGGRPIWAHEEAAALLAERAERLRREWYEQWAPTDPELAAGLAEVRVVAPDRTVHREAELTVGGRAVLLRHLGRGHTAGDLVVRVPDADVLVAGDLVEESGPPSFEDSYPLEWPDTVHELLHLAGPGTTVVPGHGATVDRAFVAGQHEALTALAWLIREGYDGDAPVEAVAAKSDWPPATALTAVRRGYAELSGRGG